MHRLEKMVRELFGPTTEIREKFFYQSKKNQVTRFSLTLSGKPHMIIAKYFVWGDARKEERILIECRRRGVPVPAVLHRKGHVLFLEHLEGETLSSRCLGENSLLQSVASWTACYHDAMKKKQMTLLKRDMRPQNFIYQGAELWGIDFEEASYGEREWDVADFLSTLIEGTDPGDTQEVLRRIRFFLTIYENSRHLCRDTLMGCLSATLKRRIIFRKQSRPWLEKWIRRLEEPLELF